MDIVFASNDRSEILHLPIVPERFEIPSPHNNQVFSTISDGDINLIGLAGLDEFSLVGWFPMKYYSFAKSSVMGTEGKAFIEKFKKRRRALRIVITNKNGIELLNDLYAIENFTPGYDRAGDMTYTIHFKQFIAKKVV